MPAEEHQAAGAVDDRLVGHEALLPQGGQRGTVSGWSCDGAMPLQAICSVIQTGFVPAARRILRVMSPTTVMSGFAVSAWMPGG